MGDFNVSCVMSGISMGYDKVALFPLIRSRFGREDGIGFSGAHYVSNQGPTGIYEFLTLPIFGQLNSYGSFEEKSIERNENTEIIEKYFGVKIEEFTRNIAYAEGPLNHVDANIVAGAYMHREIFDKFSTWTVDDYHGKDDYTALSSELIDAALELIGFKFEREDEDRERYNRLMTNPKFPNIQLWSDDNWIEIEINGKEVNSVYHLIDLIKVINRNSKEQISADTIEEIRKIPVEKIRLTQAVQKAKKWIEDRKQWIKVDDLKNKKLFGAFGVGGDLYFGYHSGFSEEFQNIYGEQLFEGKLDDLIISLRTIRSNMWNVNRMFLPTFNGCQYGNHYASKALYALSNKIVGAKIKERNSY